MTAMLPALAHPSADTNIGALQPPLAAGGAVGGRRLRHLYDLRHTYATFALRAGVSVFAVSRLMGSSLAMIDRHYSHLAVGAENSGYGVGGIAL